MQMISNHPRVVCMITKSLNEISGDFAEQDVKEMNTSMPFHFLQRAQGTQVL